MTGRMKAIRLLSALSVLGGVLLLINCPNPILDQISQRITQSNAGLSPFTSFTISSALNSAAGVTIDCQGQITGSDVAVTVPSGSIVTGLIATFTPRTGGTVSVGAKAQTIGATPNDFTSPVQYVLKAADGSTYTGKVTVTVAPSGVILGQSSMILAVGGAPVYLYASVTPSSGNTNLTWTSSAPGIAKVSPGGAPLIEIVTPVAIGTATITATTADGTKSATCAVTVTKPVPVTGVSVSPPTLNVAIGATAYVSAIILPINASNQQATWSTSDATVATLSPNAGGTYAIVVPVAVGTATITVTTADGQKTASAAVTVTPAIPISSISLPLTASVAQGGSISLTAIIAPSNATNQRLSWTTDNPAGATVSSGQVSGVLAGSTATITATSTDGSNIIAHCLVNVTAPVLVSGVALNQPTLTLSVSGSSGYLTTNITPSTATKPGVTWSTSDATVASIAYSGSSYASIYPVAAGPATITATSTDGSNKTATCTVTVTAPVAITKVSLNTTSLNIVVGGGTGYLYTTILPSTASKPQVTWSISPGTFASISSSGTNYAYISPIAVGTETVTATAADGSGKIATCTVNVSAPVAVNGVTLTNTTLNLAVGGAPQWLYTSIAPSNATNGNVTWSTSDASIASIIYSYSSGAEISGVGVGTGVIITATTTDGSNKTATCTVTVTSPVAVTGVMLNYSSMSLTVGGGTGYLYPTIVPSNATNSSVTWSSTDATTAAITQSGSTYAYISGLKAGSATITATTSDGSFTASCLIKVGAPVPVTSVLISTSNGNNIALTTIPLSLSGTYSSYAYLTFNSNVTYPTNTNVVWSSLDPTTVIVSSQGQVTGLKQGSTTIKATTVDGGFTSSCTVNVGP